MKHVVLLLLRLVLALALLYGALLACSLLVTPLHAPTRGLDTSQAPASIFSTEPKYVFLGRSGLDTPADKVLVLGASNAMAGFKQRELSKLLPRMEVHNLSVGGSNVTQLAQVAELVREVQGAAARRHNVFVLGLWYGVFASDRVRWHQPGRHPGDTDIDIERYRYGFFKRTEHGPVPLLPPSRLDVGVTLIHPYLVLDELARSSTASLRQVLSGKPQRLTDEQRNARIISAREQREYLEFWRRYMGSVDRLSDEPFVRLRQCVETLLADGARVVLVDMPIPNWHRRGSGLTSDYERRLQPLLRSLSERPGVTVLDMRGESADDDFSDEVHPKPRVSPAWAARLAQTLQGLQGGDQVARY